MKKIFQFATILAALSLLALSCNPEELSTEQFETNAVVLQAYGPQPVVRGGVLRFIGSNLQNVVSVTIPADNVITEIEVVASGVHSEIRVTVPKETSEPGFPVLTLKDGTTITGKTALSYSEPISIDEFTPAEILPGADLTIKGDYLNLIHEVIFAEKVKVSENAFKAHDRYTIKVTVPETARTGKVGLGTVDELNAAGLENEKELLATLNIVETATELVVTTAKGTVAAAPVKAGAAVNITGTNLKLVKSVKLEGATVTAFTTATDTQLSFALPETVADGDVLMVMASGVEVSAGTLTTVAPTITAVAPVPVKNGAELTITGTDLDLVKAVDMTNAAGAEFELVSETSMTVTVPEKAREGAFSLVLANGASVVDTVKLVKPTVTAFSANPAAAGSPVTITGTDLDLVAAVTFGGDIKVELPGDATATTFTVDVPTAAENGLFVLNLINGTDVQTDSLYIDKPAGAYIAALPDKLYNIGEMFIVEIENADHLTGVQIDGADVKFILNGNTLYFAIPEGSKADSQLTLVSDNGNVVYTMNIDPGDFLVTPIWTGEFNGDSWSVGCQDLAWDGAAIWNDVEPGLILRLYVEPIVGPGEWWCVQPRHGANWGKLPASVPEQFDTPEVYCEFELTAAVLEDLIANNGLVVTGFGYKLTQIALVKDLRYGDAIWQGEFIGDSWSVGCQDLAWDGAAIWATVPAGKTLFLHATSILEPDEWWCLQPRHGANWGKLPASVPEQFDAPEGPVSFVLTQEVLDDLVANNGLVITGYGYKLTKISLK